MITDTHILLPEARIDVFIEDKETRAAIKAIRSDWRFARVTFTIHHGTIDDCLIYYQNHLSGNVILVETKDIDQSFKDKLSTLADMVEEGSAAIVTGPVNDVNLYRDLKSMGVSDYLVNPVPQDTMADIIAQSLIEMMGVQDSQLISMIGTKGGVGTSVLSSLCARILSDHHKKTLILDFSGGRSSLPTLFGFEPSGTLKEAVYAAIEQDQDTLNRMIFTLHDHLSVLSVGGEPFFDTAISKEDTETLLNFLMMTYPFLVIDLSGAPVDIQQCVCMRAHQINVISTPLVTSLRVARSLIQEIKDSHGSDANSVQLMINKQGETPSNEVSIKDIEAAVNHKVAGIFQYIPKDMMAYENENKPLQSKEGKSLMQGLDKSMIAPLIGGVTKQTNQEPSLLDSLSGLLKKGSAD